MPRDNGLQAFTIRLKPEYVLLLRAYVLKQSQAQGGVRMSYSSAVAKLVQDLSPAQLDRDTLRGAGVVLKNASRAKKKAKAKRSGRSARA